MHGPFTAAVERDVWLVINDSHLMGPDGMAALYRALDYGIGGDYHLDDGRVVRRGPRHRVVMTANGTLDLLDEPVLDRCRNKVPVTIPSASMLARLVLNAGQPDECQALAVACLNDYLGGVDRVATYREWAAVADNLRSGLTLAQALGAALYTGADDNYGGYGRCVAVLDDLVLLNVPGAAALQQQIAAQHPSGAA